MISADIQTVMPEIVLAVYAMLALLAAVYTTKDKMAPLLTWLTSGLFVLLAFWISGGHATVTAFDGMYNNDGFARFAKVAKDIGAIFLVDMAHYSGLIAGGVYPNPVPHADVVTTTTHKTLRGPRGGLILTNSKKLNSKINSAVFPGLQGGPLMHVIAAKAVAFGEALRPEFKDYTAQVVKNAQALADQLMKGGLVKVGVKNGKLELTYEGPEQARITSKSDKPPLLTAD